MTTSLSTGETSKNLIIFFLIQSNQVCLIMFENSSALNGHYTFASHFDV